MFLDLLNTYKHCNLGDSINYELINEAFISHHSTAIEGSSLTVEESRLLLTESLTAKGKPLYDHHMVVDHHDALLWLIQQAKEKRSITPAFIQEISARVMQHTGSVINSMAGSYNSAKGDWRKSNVFVGSRYFVGYEKVQREVAHLTNKLEAANRNVKTDIEIYNLAFDAHFYLVTIHPFADGNGRVSRLLMNYILACHHQPLANVYKEDKLDYYAALEESRKDNELDPQPIRAYLYAQQEKYFRQEIELFQKKDHLNYEL